MNDHPPPGVDPIGSARPRSPQLEADEKELAALRTELASRTLELRELHDVAAGARAEAAAQRVAFARLQQKTAECEATIEAMREEAAERDAAIEKLRGEIETLTAHPLTIIGQSFKNLRFLFKRKTITLADRASKAGDWATAAHLYRRALKRNPKRPEIWIQYGHVLKEDGRLSPAEQAYRQAIALTPTAVEPYQYLGDVLRAQGKRDDSVATYLQARSLDPASADLLSGLRRLGWMEK